MRVFCRLVTYDAKGNRHASTDVSGLDLKGAVYRAVQEGYESGKDFHVIELGGQAPHLYWNGLANDPRVHRRNFGHWELIQAPFMWTVIERKLNGE